MEANRRRTGRRPGRAPAVMAAVLAAGLLALFGAAATPPSTTPAGPSLQQLRDAAQRNPADGAAAFALARGLQDAGEHADALAAFERAIAAGYLAPIARLRSAQSAAALGDQARAVELVESVAAGQPAYMGFLDQIGGIPSLQADPRLLAAKAAARVKRYPCTVNAEHGQFDFWLGRWSVFNPAGVELGRSVISKDLSHCVVREDWTDGLGGRGSSVNFYDPATRRWHQVWTSDSGTVTHYVGALEDGEMRFLAEGFGDADGVTKHRRMTFTPLADGTVRQHLADSTDGETWVDSFVGIYRPQPASAEP